MARRNESKCQGSPEKLGGEDINNERAVLRKVGKMLTLFFKPDPELKTFLSILMDDMIHERMSLDEIVDLLNDKKKRKKYLSLRK